VAVLLVYHLRMWDAVARICPVALSLNECILLIDVHKPISVSMESRHTAASGVQQLIDCEDVNMNDQQQFIRSDAARGNKMNRPRR
jgi:hypothetical protein